MAGAKKKAKKVVKKVSDGIVTVICTFNNVLISVQDLQGNTLAWESSGSTGFSARRRATPFAAQEAMKKLIQKILPMGLKKVRVLIRGPGSAESVLRTINSSGIIVDEYSNVTRIPHNGCRAPKERRV